MPQTKIIGHRGAAGLELENTLGSLRKAIALGVHAIEFDVRATSDGRFVLCHDETLSRLGGPNKKIRDLTYAELKQTPLSNGEHVPLLKDVLTLARKHNVAVVVEVKVRDHLDELCELLDEFSDLDMVVASFLFDTLTAIRGLRPDYRLYTAEEWRPIEVLYRAKFLKAEGIDLNYKLLNPLTYYLARRWKLDIMVYTINSRFMKSMVSKLYPRIAICTDFPDRFIPKKRSKKAKGAAHGSHP
jgi:glycerophosphoryl diester phosphodiesterase